MVIQKTPTKIDKIVSLQIGQHQENVATQIKMDVSDWITVHPTAGFHVLFKRPGEVLAQPVLSSLEEGILTWTVQEWETSLLGVGYAEVRAIEAESALVAKSRVIPCAIEESIAEDGDVPPEYSGWVERVLKVGDLADDLEQEITEGIEDIQAESATQVGAVQAKGTEVLNSIPADYLSLVDQFNALVRVQANQPSEAANKLWVDSDTVAETEVPTMGEFNELKSTLDAETEDRIAGDNEVKSLFADGVQSAVNAWLDDHPEATTTVQDGAITFQKFNDGLQNALNDIAPINFMLSDAIGETYNDKLQSLLLTIDRDCRIFLPPGVIRLGEIELPKNIRVAFIGAGMGTNGVGGTIIKPIASSTSYIFAASDIHCDYHTFCGMQFDGENTCEYGIKGLYATGFMIDRCSFMNFTNTACVLGLGLNTVVDSFFRATDTSKCLVIHSDSHVRDSEFSGGNPSVQIEASGNRFAGNLVNGGLCGILLEPALSPTDSSELTPIANNNVITGSYIGNVRGYGVYIHGTNGNATGNVFSNNYHEMTYRNGEGAVHAVSCKTVQITNCILRGNASTSMSPAVVLEHCENSLVANIMAYNVWNDLITLDHTNDTLISNIVARNGDGIFLKLTNSYRNLLDCCCLYNDGSGTVVYANSVGGSSNIFKNCKRNDYQYNIASGDTLFDSDFEKTITENITPIVSTSSVFSSYVKKTGSNVEIYFDIVISEATTRAMKILDIPNKYRSADHTNAPLWFTTRNQSNNSFLSSYIQAGGIYLTPETASGTRLTATINYIV